MPGRGVSLKGQCSQVVSQVCMSKRRQLLTRIWTSKLPDNSSVLRIVAFRLIVMLLFYELFKPVNKSINLLAVYFNIAATTMQAVTGIFLLTPLILQGGEHSLTAFTPEQLHALALVAMKVYHLCYTIALAFFGCYDLLIGYLAFKSTFIPRPIGVLMIITGLG
jgi:Domain of unknown function (DUF4386)